MMRAVARLLRGTVVLLLGLLCAVMFAVLALAWRLANGPLDIEWAARRAEAMLNTSGAGERLLIGRAELEWPAYRNPKARGLLLRLSNVRLGEPGGGRLATAAQLELTLSAARLLRGELVPRTLAAQNLDVQIQIGPDDDHAPETTAAAAPTLSEVIAELAHPVRSDDVAFPVRLSNLEQLRSVALTGASVTLQDRLLGPPWKLTLATLDLNRQPAGGVQGSAVGELGFGALHAGIHVDANLAPDGGTQAQARLSRLDAGEADRTFRGLGTENALDATLGAVGTLKLSPQLLPERATLGVETGSGTIRLAATPIALQSLSLDADAEWASPAWSIPDRLQVRSVRGVVSAPGGAWPTTTTLSATLARTAAGRIEGSADATFDHVAFADLGALWPAPLGGHVRPWLVENLTSGTARDGHVSAKFTVAANGTDPALTAVSGGLSGEDATIHWLRPVPPIEHASALLTINEPKTLDIAVSTGRTGALTLSRGQLHFTGLDEKDQFLALSTDIAGPVADLLNLLRHPRLHLLDRKPLPIRGAGGAFSGRLSVDLPLEEHLEFDQVRIAATGRATDLRLLGLIAGRNLDRGDIGFDVTPDGLQAKGDAQVAGIQSKITANLDFKSGGPAQVQTSAEAIAPRATPRQLAAAGVDPGGVMPSGTVGLTTRYTQHRDGNADVLVKADLADAALSLVGWRKPPGQLATAGAHLLLRNDRLLGIDGIEATAPGLSVQGHLDLIGTKPLNLVLDHLVLGQTDAAGQVQFPDTPANPIRAKLSGPAIDLSSQLAKSDTPGASADEPPWIADIHFDRVILSADRSISGVTAHADHDGRRLRTLDATSTGPERLDLHLHPAGTQRKLTATVADLGALLRAADWLDTVDGGRLSLEAEFDDSKPGSPLAGKAEVSDFRVHKAPALGKLLQAVTIYGAFEALSGPGLSFLQLTAPFRYAGDILELTDARAFSASLGLTARGRFDAARNTLDMHGTVVPAYALNAALGHIPLVGRLFSAERGGGLVALNYALRGPAANPTVSVNPLSALTPGFLRGLFHILE